jgi:hypothetical protein
VPPALLQSHDARFAPLHQGRRASCRSKLHSSFGAEQQFNAKLLLQVEDGLADRGLRHVQAAGRLAVVQMMSDADEVTQMAKLHNFMLIAESDCYKQIITISAMARMERYNWQTNQK